MASLRDLYPAILTFILVGVLLGVGLMVTQGLGDNVYTTSTALNDTFTPINGTAVNLGNDAIISTTGCFNVTGFTTIGVNNYTIDAEQGTFLLHDYQGIYGLDIGILGCNYTYKGGIPFDSIASTSDALGDFAGWFSIIVLIIAASVIIGLVMMSFTSGRR